MTTLFSPPRRRDRSPSLSAGDTRPIEPLWDPVVVMPDPWRRDSTPTADEIAERSPRYVWPTQTIADRIVTSFAFAEGTLIESAAPQTTLAADLAMRVAPAVATSSAADDGLHLTEQLTATARAMNLVPRFGMFATEPQPDASAAPTPQSETATADTAGDAVEAVSTVSAGDITAMAELESMEVAAEALASASAEIAELKEMVSAALAPPMESDAETAFVATPEFGDDRDAVGGDDAAGPVDRLLMPAMAARVESADEGTGFDTVRPPLRVATMPVDEPSTEVTSSAMEIETQVEARLDPSSMPIEVTEAAPNEPAIDAAPASPENVDSAAESVADDSDPAGAAKPEIADALPEVAAAEIEPATVVELPPDNESTVPAVAEAQPAVADLVVQTAPVVVKPVKTPASSVLAPAVRDEYNRTGVDFRRPWPRPKVRGRVIDYHCHLLARRHAEDWFEAADHYGIDCFVTMSPLEEAVLLARDWGHRLRFIAVPKWADDSTSWVDQWLTRIEAFYNLGSRIAKFHAAPGTMVMRGHRLDSPVYKPLFAEVKARGMAIMTHIGDPETWYQNHYTDTAKFGTRDEHYAMWESLLEEHRGHPWIGAHLGGNPEDLVRLQRLLDTFPNLMLDCSATRWMVREISARREPAREFFIRNADRILFGSDQVSGDDRQFDFLASRIWCHRKLWETAYIGDSPIIDPDVPADQQPTVRGLALPDAVLQKIYHDNTTKLLDRLGMGFDSAIQ